MAGGRWLGLLLFLCNLAPDILAIDYDNGNRYTDFTDLGTSANNRRPSPLLSVPRYDWSYQAPRVPSFVPEAASNVHFSAPSNVFDINPNTNFFARMAHDVMNKVISTVAGSYSDDRLFPLYRPSTPEVVEFSTTAPEETPSTDVVRNMEINPASSTEQPPVPVSQDDEPYFVRELKRNKEASNIFANIEHYANPQVPLEEYLDGVPMVNPKSLKYEKPDIRFSPRKKYTYKVQKQLDSSEDYERVFPTTTTRNPTPSIFERKAVQYFVGQSLSPRLVIDSLPEKVSTTAIPMVDRNTVIAGSDERPVRITPRRRSKNEKNRLMWMRKIHRALDSYKKHQKKRKSRKHRHVVHLPVRYE
uniref:Uncharacterized protein n=1 Tax=Steinernema glaseri TaxID=37863 RepID=A0A1I8A8V8_9BILA